MSFGLTVLGSVNLDLIVQVKTLPKAGETVTGGTYTALPGGKGANVAVRRGGWARKQKLWRLSGMMITRRRPL